MQRKWKAHNLKCPEKAAIKLYAKTHDVEMLHFTLVHDKACHFRLNAFQGVLNETQALLAYTCKLLQDLPFMEPSNAVPQ